MLKERLVKIVAHAVVLVNLILFPLILAASLIHAVLRVLFPKKILINISNDIAVITGGAHGLGKAFAEVLAKKGCRICIVDINQELGEEVAKEIATKYKVRTKAYKVDVSNFKQIEALHEQIDEEFGTATILINNAGILRFTNLANPDPAEVQKMINVNFTAHYWMNRIFLPGMKRKRRGYIVATCSLAGVIPVPCCAEYTGTKWGLRGYMRTLRLELLLDGYKNIVCTNVQPFFLTTNECIRDMLNQITMESIYPMMSGEEVAKLAVDGMLRGDAEISMPYVFGILYRLADFLPSEFQSILYYRAMKCIGVMENYKKTFIFPLK